MTLRGIAWFFAAAAAALMVSALACSTPRQNLAEDEPAPAQSGRQGFSLVINNRHYLDVNIFMHHDGQTTRVETVTGSSSAALMVPGWMLGKGSVIRLSAEPVGDVARYVTDNLVIQPGQIVELDVENAIGRSSYRVR